MNKQFKWVHKTRRLGTDSWLEFCGKRICSLVTAEIRCEFGQLKKSKGKLYLEIDMDNVEVVYDNEE